MGRVISGLLIAYGLVAIALSNVISLDGSSDTALQRKARFVTVALWPVMVVAIMQAAPDRKGGGIDD